MISEEWEVIYGKGRFILPLFICLTPIVCVFWALGITDMLLWQIIIIPYLFGGIYWVCILQGWIKTPDKEATQ